MEKLEKDFLLLRGHCIVIRRDYNTYTRLFNEENRDLLSKVAATFFTEVAEIMQRDWLLQVCKIMDPASTKYKDQIFENITLSLIDEQLVSNGLSNRSIDDLSAKLKSYGEKIKPARRKRLAHYDRDQQINGITLGETTDAELREFLLNIQRYCDEAGIAIGIGPLEFSGSGCQGDVLDFLKFLGGGSAKYLTKMSN
jgi:hypothetical protein